MNFKICGNRILSYDRYIIWFVISLILSACGERIGLAPVVQGGNSERFPLSSAIKPNAGPVVIVQSGQTLYKIARLRNVGLRNLIDANNLRPPYTIYPGQKLRLPRTDIHVVIQNETIYQIAKRYNTEPRVLVRLNRIQPPYKLFLGQRIAIPGSRDRNDKRLRGRAIDSGNVAGKDLYKTTAKQSQTKQPTHSRNKTKNRGQTMKPNARPSSPSKSGFIWPINGRVLSRFGTIGKGLQNDGINILAQKGTPVRAAQSGIVAYAGNELRGFGNLLLIKHPGGWISAYAHNSELLVETGERVDRGQIVSKVGRTGSVDRAQLHFELRRGKRAVDPERFLGRRTALLID